MTLGEFLKLIAGEYVRVFDGQTQTVDADKNAIRAYRPELLERTIYLISPVGKTRFEVRLNK